MLGLEAIAYLMTIWAQGSILEDQGKLDFVKEKESDPAIEVVIEEYYMQDEMQKRRAEIIRDAINRADTIQSETRLGE